MKKNYLVIPLFLTITCSFLERNFSLAESTPEVYKSTSTNFDDVQLQLKDRVASIKLEIDQLNDTTPKEIFTGSVGKLIRDEILVLGLNTKTSEQDKTKNDYLIRMVYTQLSKKIMSYISVHGVHDLSAEGIRALNRAVFAPSPLDSKERIKIAKWMAEFFGSIKQEKIVLSKVISTCTDADFEIKRDSCSKQTMITLEFPRIKNGVMYSILAAFTPQDAKQIPPDLAFCIEKARLTPEDKKELLFGLAEGKTSWRDIPHPADVEAKRKSDEAWEKNREKILAARATEKSSEGTSNEPKPDATSDANKSIVQDDK